MFSFFVPGVGSAAAGREEQHVAMMQEPNLENKG